MKPTEEQLDKYQCTNGKTLLVCDLCGHLYCGYEHEGAVVPYTKLVIHKCFSCSIGGLK